MPIALKQTRFRPATIFLAVDGGLIVSYRASSFIHQCFCTAHSLTANIFKKCRCEVATCLPVLLNHHEFFALSTCNL